MNRSLVAFAVLAALAGPARGDDDTVRAHFLKVEGKIDPRNPAAIAQLTSDLAALSSHWAESDLPPGPVRSALARSLSAERAGALLDATKRDPEVHRDRMVFAVSNLAARDDISDLLLAEDRFLPLLPRGSRTLLVTIAETDIVLGDDRLARVLLRDPGAAAEFAKELCDMKWAHGIRLLADVVTGKVSVPPVALARIAVVDPQLQVHNIRPLGTTRIRDLARVAGEADDHALRLFAARLLLLSGTRESIAALIRALPRIRTVRLERYDDCYRIGADHGRRVMDPAVPLWARLTMLRRVTQFSGIAAGEYPHEMEASAAELRQIFADADAAMRGLLCRELYWLADYYVDSRGLRKRPVPSWVALLDDLKRGMAGSLGRRVATGLRQQFTYEPAPHWRREERLPRRERTLPDALTKLTPHAVARIVAEMEGTESQRATLVELQDDVQSRVFSKWFEHDDLDAPDVKALLVLDEQVLQALIGVLDEHPDPLQARLAATILDLTGDARAWNALIARSEWLWASSIDRSPTVPSPARFARTPAERERVLATIADRRLSHYVRARLFEVYLNREAWPPAISTWIKDVVPTLDAGLHELILRAWLAHAERIEEDATEHANEIRAAYDAAVARVKAAGPRIRLLDAVSAN